ncbi:MAG: hypothetical protein QOG25_642 [Acetobacteraceae bacterium]|nr:hypothetical protein [Acetobacteraceae bacterium]
MITIDRNAHWAKHLNQFAVKVGLELAVPHVAVQWASRGIPHLLQTLLDGQIQKNAVWARVGLAEPLIRATAMAAGGRNRIIARAEIAALRQARGVLSLGFFILS